MITPKPAGGAQQAHDPKSIFYIRSGRRRALAADSAPGRAVARPIGAERRSYCSVPRYAAL